MHDANGRLGLPVIQVPFTRVTLELLNLLRDFMLVLGLTFLPSKLSVPVSSPLCWTRSSDQ